MLSASSERLRMRVLQASLAVMLLLAPLSGCFGIGGDSGLFGEEDEKEPLRLNHIQMEGTHNSYHI